MLSENTIATHWDISNQCEPTGATNSTELFAFHKGIIKVSDICNFSSSIGYFIGDPSTLYEDNVGTIKAITLDYTNTTHIHHDVKIFTVIHHKQKETISVEHSKYEHMLADPNTKPHGDKTLRMKIDRLIETKF
eukprot:14213941-Ditylum_brightwellii.AAC.1